MFVLSGLFDLCSDLVKKQSIDFYLIAGTINVPLVPIEIKIRLSNSTLFLRDGAVVIKMYLAL